MKRILFLVLCLLAALFCYAVGFQSGAVVLIVVGLVFEGGFWMLAFRGMKSS